MESALLKLIRALSIVKRHIGLVAGWACLGMSIMSYSSLLNLIMLGNAFLYFIIAPIVYGRFMESIRSDPPSSLTDLLRCHFVNFMIVSIILIVPTFIAGSIFDKLILPITEKMFVLTIGAVINVLTIYVIPFVFLRKSNYQAIPMGMKYMFCNIKESLPLILFIIIQFAIKVAAYLMVYHLQYMRENIFIILSVGYVHNILTLCIGLVVFSSACINILETSRLQAERNCSTLDSQ